MIDVLKLKAHQATLGPLNLKPVTGGDGPQVLGELRIPAHATVLAVARLLKKMKCLSLKTLPVVAHAIALASRSKSVPVVVRASQPSPIVTAVRPGACLVRLTFPPLVRLIPTRSSEIVYTDDVDASATITHSRKL